MNNPFDITFGRVPEIYIDREEILATTVRSIKNHSPLCQTNMIYGMRGSGKTTFMTDLTNILSQEKNWICINLSDSENLIQDLSDYLDYIVHSRLGGRKKIEGLGIGALGFSASVSAKEAEPSAKVKIEMNLARLKQKGISLLVTLDEVTNSRSTREFASYDQVLIRSGYPITLLLAGLPENVSDLINHEVMTFLLRANRISLSRLGDYAVMNSYRHIFTDGGRKLDEDTLLHMTALVHGYAYAFQLLGHLLWENSSRGDPINLDLLETIGRDFRDLLYQNVYFILYRRLTEVEQSYLRIMSDEKDRLVPSAYINKKLGKGSSYCNVYRSRLLERQIIEAPKFGYVSFSLPFFRDFLLTQKKLEELSY